MDGTPFDASSDCVGCWATADGAGEPNVGAVPPEVPAGMFTQRELYMAKREANGELAFEYVENDGTPNHNMWCALTCNPLSLKDH